MSQTLASTDADAHADAALIGPNAVTQLRAALDAAGIDPVPLFRAAGVVEWLDHPPDAMIDEARVARLHRAVRDALPFARSSALLADAGRRTADYLLAHRIPRPARAVLKSTPPRLAAALFVPAIRAHAWTFCGSGDFAGQAGKPTVFTMTGNPMIHGEVSTAPLCVWHAAVFQRLFQVLVARSARAVETECEASGGACCRFVVDW